MASIRRRLGTRFWFACFYDANGARRQRSTKTASRKDALKIATAFEEVATKRATEAQTRRVLAELHEQIHGSPLALFTVKSYAEQWLARKKVETREVSYAAYKGALDGFLEFIGDKRNQSISYITPAIIAAWRDASARKATPRTANNKLKIIRTFLQTAWRDGLLPDSNPAAKVPILSTGESSRRPLTHSEIRAALAVANEEWRGMILAGFYTGQRLKDLAGLGWNNIDLQKGEIRLSTSKTNRRQFLPIAQPLRSYLEALEVGDDPKAPVFPALYPHAKKPGGSARLSTQFNEILVAAGLVAPRPPKDKSTGKGRDGARTKTEISFHSLRHSATSMLKQAGVSESVTRDIIGHDSADVSANYTHVDDDSKRKAIECLPDITL